MNGAQVLPNLALAAAMQLALPERRANPIFAPKSRLRNR